MKSIILTWNNKDLLDLRIVTDNDLPKLFELSTEAREYAEEKFMNFEIVTFYDSE